MNLRKDLKIVFFLFILSLLVVTFVFLFSKKEGNLEIYALRYGKSTYHSKNIYYNDILNKSLPFSWMFYVIKYKDKTILVDTGFEEDLFIEFFNIDYEHPLIVLERLGINPKEVTDVILTHSHFDHIGNVDKFKKAKIYIQEDELNEFKESSNDKDLVNFLEGNKNIIVFNKSYKLYNFFNIEKIGGHTLGSSVVSFFSENRKYILTGDECYLLDNCKGKPIGVYYDIDENKKFIERIKKEDNIKILTFHDPLVFQKHQKINDSIVKIR